MIILNKKCAIEAYVIRKFSELLFLETEKMEVLTNDDFCLEKHVVDLISGQIDAQKFLDVITQETQKIEDIESKINKTKKELMVLIEAIQDERYDEIIFE